MLESELRGLPYSKTSHRQSLQRLLNGRSGPAIEFKHANISAVLTELGYPYIDGYKPRGNYQELLRSELVVQLQRRPAIAQVTAALVAAEVADVPTARDLADIFVAPPKLEKPRATYERQSEAESFQKVNYLEREAANASLGLAGEKFVLEIEHRRLRELGAPSLADKIEHSSTARGDGLGFDILSYEPDGRERLIEVKTTLFGSMTPFFASAKEVRVSESERGFHLYRVFKFRERPQVFCLAGSLRDSCRLDPTQFRARLA